MDRKRFGLFPHSQPNIFVFSSLISLLQTDLYKAYAYFYPLYHIEYNFLFYRIPTYNH